MTFPAEMAFRHDRTLSPTQKAVYLYLLSIPLDLEDYQPIKGEIHAEQAGVSRKTFGLAVDTLVRRGYLKEAERGLHNVRQLKLAYSVKLAEQKRAS